MTGRTLSLDLVIPPSLNGAWCNVPGRGRVRTATYRTWARQALAAISIQARGASFPGSFRVSVLASDRELTRRRDVDNLGKALCDTLTKAGIIADDCYLHLRSIALAWTPDLPAGSCLVTVIELAPVPLPKPAASPRRVLKQASSRNTRAGAKVPASIMAALKRRGINVTAERVHLG
jgi:Holliday junction resolvase RusA-like endonuclease